MNKDRAAFPLYWPDQWPRTPAARRTGSQFKTSLTKAMTNVEEELRRFAKDSGKKISGLLISSNFSLTDRRPADPGVSCYFEWDGITTCICVDRYNKLEDNLQAIFRCLEAERTKLRHGGINLVRAAFRGYAALPPPKSNKRDWMEVLGITVSDAGRVEVVEKAYKRLRSKYHPDRPTGDKERFNEVLQAWEEYQVGLPA